MMKMHSMLTHRPIVRVEALAAVFRREALDQLRVRMKFFLAAVKLPLTAQDYVRAALDSLNRSADMDGLVDQRLQVADGFSIAAETYHKEMAVRVRRLRAADIQKVCATRRIHHSIHMRRNAGVFIDMLERLVGRNACMGGPRRDGGQHWQYG